MNTAREVNNRYTPRAVNLAVWFEIVAALLVGATNAQARVVKDHAYVGRQVNGFRVTFRTSSDGRRVERFSAWIESGCSNEPVRLVLASIAVRHGRFRGSSRIGRATARVTGRFQPNGDVRGQIRWLVPQLRDCDDTRLYAARP